MNSGLFNLASLLLGLLAWILPIVNIRRIVKADYKNWTFISFASMTACAISLYMQIVYNKHLVDIEDISAIMDITWAITLCSTVLLVGTVALNALAAAAYFKIMKTEEL